jgi:hypothetical protein
LIVLHRYLGVTVGSLMLLWCLSGVVMLFVRYPQVTEAERLSRLPPVAWTRCCDFAAGPNASAQVGAAVVEDVAGSPVLRLKMAGGHRQAIDLATGRPFDGVSAEAAKRIAMIFAGQPAAGVQAVERDQWTVSGEFNRGRPFWRVRMADGRGTDVYVSRASGEVVQRTTAWGRRLNWLGAVPHWLYPQVLRQHTGIWTQVVNWTSLVGIFLTVTGLYLGVIAWRPFRDGRLSPYRGLMTWHHLTGLAVGVLTLTWVTSGLVSMNPWGFLEGVPDPARARIAGEAPTFGEVQAALQAAAAQRPATGQLRLARFDGRLFVMAGDVRLDAQGRPAALPVGELTAMGLRLDPEASQAMITREDTYYFNHHDAVRLPAWRVLTTDGHRYYLDPRDGALLASRDASAKTYRWLHEGLHRLDFVPGFRQGAVWAAAVLILLVAVTFGVGTGVWLSWRRVAHDFTQIRRRGRNAPISRDR